MFCFLMVEYVLCDLMNWLYIDFVYVVCCFL